MLKIPIAWAGLALGSSLLFAQGPISDTVKVTLPNPAQVGSNLLPAGEYQIRQLPTASSPRLLEFTSADGTKFETSITAIPTIDNNNRNETSVELEQRGNRYFVKRIWIAGKTYGYQIPFDETQLAGGASTETRRLTASFEAASPAPAPVEVAAARPAPEPEPAPAPAVTPEPAPAAAPDPAPAATAAPAPEPAPAAQQPAPAPQEAAPAPRRTETEELPQTAGDWAGSLLIGAALLVFGTFLRRSYVK